MKVSLTDICDFQGGTQPPKDEWIDQPAQGYVRMLQIRDFTQSDKNYIEYVKDTGKLKTCIEDDILIGRYGASIGKILTGLAGAYNVAIVKTIPDEKVVSKKYLYWYLNSQYFQRFISNVGSRAAQAGFNKNDLGAAQIPLVDKERQEEICEVLEKANKLISLRKQQLAKLDELVKARFVEMFGDEQAFNKEPLSQNVEEMFIGPFGSSLKNESFVSKENGYCMVYEQKHAIRKTMDVETRYIDKPKYEELKRFSIHGGDIIVSCRGTIGETYIVPLNAPLGIMHPSIMKIRVKDSIYNRVFFDFLLQEKLMQHEAQANGSGVKMAVTASALGKEEFIVPSIPFQNQFAAFAERVDQQKQTIQQSLEKLELMKKALMQEYFG
ncbi:restriction endonuclease subunit S [Faecalibacterium sp. HTF-128]|uniref:Restriction endonuclease subunit S n=1 Tax=Faecalibacterium wellingii TaxID=2929491 RepID=A0AB35Y1M3_9FIRM